MISNSPSLLTFSVILWAEDAVFAGKVAKYDASSAGVSEPVELTVTVQVAVLLPSTVITVIVAFPTDAPETVPL
jgi:hypothetical protein